MVKLLRKIGYNVLYNPQQTCCGQPAFNAGFWEDAQAVAEKFIGDMSLYKVPIVCPSASCTGFVRNYICDFPIKDAELNKGYERVQRQMFEFTEFLVEVAQVTDFGAKLYAKAVYHDACSALRECKIKTAPRLLLQGVEGLQLLEMPEADQCCGFGGTFSVKFEPISVAMAEKKVENALSVGAEYIISGDLSCLMQLNAYIKNKKINIKTLHIADVLVL